MIDERNYTVVGINGFRQGNLTLTDARKLAAIHLFLCVSAGWAGVVRIFYRDGTEVKPYEKPELKEITAEEAARRLGRTTKETT